jgi:hypothetical protein
VFSVSTPIRTPRPEAKIIAIILRYYQKEVNNENEVLLC